MNDDELERLLSQAFDAQAATSVPDSAVPPPPRFELEAEAAQPSSPAHAHELARADVEHLAAHRATVTDIASRRRRLFAPLAAAAAVVASVGITVAVMHHSDKGAPGAAGTTQATFQKPIVAPRNARNVHIKLLQGDGQQFGIAVPVIAYLSRKITDARSLQAATRVTVDGTPLDAEWYIEPSNADPAYPYEAHLRPQAYWPAHSHIHVSVATRGLSAGKGLGFDDDVSLSFKTGMATKITVNAQTHLLTVTRDGVDVFHCAVVLGRAATPTTDGYKVIMDKAKSASIFGLPTYKVKGVAQPVYAQRLTYSGEFLQVIPGGKMPAAHQSLDASNGSTLVSAQSAAQIYALTEIGDLVDESSVSGPPMTIGAGYGDWNINWPTWQQGGAVRTH